MAEIYLVMYKYLAVIKHFHESILASLTPAAFVVAWNLYGICVVWGSENGTLGEIFY